MTSVVLEHEAERGLRTLAALTGRSEPEVLREAIMRYLEDIEDAREAEAVYRRIQAGEETVIGLDEHLRDDLAS
jgi:predicted DNA-binding protein